VKVHIDESGHGKKSGRVEDFPVSRTFSDALAAYAQISFFKYVVFRENLGTCYSHIPSKKARDFRGL
jgi:hypothetical protein